MLPSTTSQPAPAAFPSPGILPSAMTSTAAAAAAPDEENIFGVGADETFFSSLGALVPSPPPSSSSSHGTTSPELRWPSSNGALAPATAAPLPPPPPPPANAGTLSESTEGPFPPLLVAPTSTAAPGQGLGPQKPLLPPGNSNSASGERPMAPLQAPAAGMPPQPPLPPLPPPPPPLVAPAASRAKKAPGLSSSKSRAKGGGIRQKRPKSSASAAAGAAAGPRREVSLDDGEIDKKASLLVVRREAQQLACAAGTGSSGSNADGGAMEAAASVDDTVKMLTAEMKRNGRDLETEYVDTGQRAVLQMEALARFDMRYGMVVLEVEESLDAAAEVAGELRAANRSTPIVAVAPPRLFQASPPPLAQKYFNENLQFPVPARKVRGLATRWLLPPPSCSGAAAPSGMVGELDPGLTAWAAAAGHAAGGGGCISGGSTITPTSVPSSLPGGGFPSQQQQRGGGGVPSNAPSCGSSAAAAGGGALLASGRTPEILTKPRASMPSAPPSPSFSASASGESGRLQPPPPLPISGRIFGGGAEDRASPCRLFGHDFEKQNAEMEAREYDFMFRHGTIVLRVEEDDRGETSAEVFSACEYATAHFGNITGKPLESMFEFPATNENTARKILEHIKKSDTDSMCSYINLKSQVRWMTSSFVCVRSLSKKPERGPGHEPLPPWYVILKVCLPTTLGLIKEPELLEHMYSKKATEAHNHKEAAKKNSRKSKAAASMRSAKKTKMASSVAGDGEGSLPGGACN